MECEYCEEPDFYGLKPAEEMKVHYYRTAAGTYVRDSGGTTVVKLLIHPERVKVSFYLGIRCRNQ